MLSRLLDYPTTPTLSFFLAALPNARTLSVERQALLLQYFTESVGTVLGLGAQPTAQDGEAVTPRRLPTTVLKNATGLLNLLQSYWGSLTATSYTIKQTNEHCSADVFSPLEHLLTAHTELLLDAMCALRGMPDDDASEDLNVSTGSVGSQQDTNLVAALLVPHSPEREFCAKIVSFLTGIACSPGDEAISAAVRRHATACLLEIELCYPSLRAICSFSPSHALHQNRHPGVVLLGEEIHRVNAEFVGRPPPEIDPLVHYTDMLTAGQLLAVTSAVHRDQLSQLSDKGGSLQHSSANMSTTPIKRTISGKIVRPRGPPRPLQSALLRPFVWVGTTSRRCVVGAPSAQPPAAVGVTHEELCRCESAIVAGFGAIFSGTPISALPWMLICDLIWLLCCIDTEVPKFLEKMLSRADPFALQFLNCNLRESGEGGITPVISANILRVHMYLLLSDQVPEAPSAPPAPKILRHLLNVPSSPINRLRLLELCTPFLAADEDVMALLPAPSAPWDSPALLRQRLLTITSVSGRTSTMASVFHSLRHLRDRCWQLTSVRTTVALCIAEIVVFHPSCSEWVAQLMCSCSPGVVEVLLDAVESLDSLHFTWRDAGTVTMSAPPSPRADRSMRSQGAAALLTEISPTAEVLRHMLHLSLVNHTTWQLSNFLPVLARAFETKKVVGRTEHLEYLAGRIRELDNNWKVGNLLLLCVRNCIVSELSELLRPDAPFVGLQDSAEVASAGSYSSLSAHEVDRVKTSAQCLRLTVSAIHFLHAVQLQFSSPVIHSHAQLLLDVLTHLSLRAALEVLRTSPHDADDIGHYCEDREGAFLPAPQSVSIEVELEPSWAATPGPSAFPHAPSGSSLSSPYATPHKPPAQEDPPTSIPMILNFVVRRKIPDADVALQGKMCHPAEAVGLLKIYVRPERDSDSLIATHPIPLLADTAPAARFSVQLAPTDCTPFDLFFTHCPAVHPPLKISRAIRIPFERFVVAIDRADGQPDALSLTGTLDTAISSGSRGRGRYFPPPIAVAADESFCQSLRCGTWSAIERLAQLVPVSERARISARPTFPRYAPDPTIEDADRDEILAVFSIHVLPSILLQLTVEADDTDDTADGEEGNDGDPLRCVFRQTTTDWRCLRLFEEFLWPPRGA